MGRGDFSFCSSVGKAHMRFVLMVLVIGYCDLVFVWNLVLVIWNFTIE